MNVRSKAIQYYLMVEALKINEDTDMLWLYEDSLKELSMIIREPKWCPIVFSADDPSASRMSFTMYLRRPEVGPETIDCQIQVKMDYNGFTHLEAHSGLYNTSPSHTAVEKALRRKLRILCEQEKEGKAFRVVSEELLRLKDDFTREEHWQLKALADLRHWLRYFEVEPSSS